MPRSAWIEIDLDALVSNAHLLQRSLPAGIRLEAVVKGDAYGHGAVPVARTLVAAGVQSLSVATFDEGLELRQAGIAVPILILFPIPPELVADAMRLCLSVTAGDQTLLERTLAVLDRLGADATPADATPADAAPTDAAPADAAPAAATPADAAPAAATPADAAAVSGDRKLPIHLEVETGLGRGGLHSTDVPAAAAAIEASPRARFAGLWSHLQAAGDSDRTADQADRLGIASSLLEEVGITMPDRHLAASGGLLAASAPGYDVVRIGLAMYGIVPDGLAVDGRHAATAAGLKPILSLRARPVRVTELAAGTGVSYGPTFVTSRRSRIATLPLGYADGLPRSLSNKAQVLVRGRRVPAVGTVAMDAVMIDVTDVPGAPVSVDDEFTLIGTQGDETIDAIEMARWGNTISYEVVTAMSGRLPRVYYAAAKAVQMRAVAWDLGWGGEEIGRPDALTSEEEPGPLGCE